MKEQYKPLFRTAGDVRDEWGGWRSAVFEANGSMKTRFVGTLDEAKAALDTVIKNRNKGARTENICVGDFGVDIVIDAESAQYFSVAKTRIVKRLVTDWEEVEEDYGL